MSVVCCQVEVSALGLPLVQRSPTELGVSECDSESLTMRLPCSTGEVLPTVVCLSVVVNP